MTDPTAPADPTPVAAPAPAAPPATDAIVDQWQADWFFNLGLPTPLQNRIADACADLRSRLAK